MKILAISDMHGDLSPAKRLLSERNWDLVLCCGDWGDPNQVTERDFQELLDLARIHTVFGNHDDRELLERLGNRDGSPLLLENAVGMDFQGLTIVGISGIWAKSHRLPWYVTDEDVASLGKTSPKPDILITHCCAVGLNDLTPTNRHGGHLCLTELFAALGPRVHISGHLHRAQVRQLKSSAWVANTGSTRDGDYLIITNVSDDWSVEQRRVQADGP